MQPVRVLHVLPTDSARGAQVYTRALVDELGGVATGHRIVMIFDGPRLAANADDELGVPATGRRLGIDPRAVVRLRALVQRTRPEVVIGHGAETAKYLMPLRALRHRPRLALYAIGVALPKAHRPAVRAAYRALLRTPDAVAAVSHEVVADCHEVFGVPINRLHYVPNGRRVPAEPPADLGARPSPTVCFVGHLTQSKRPAMFLDTVRQLRAGGFTGKAWMAGDGPLLEEVRRQASGLDVEVLGRRTDVPALLAEADLMCFTSIADGEGMPGVLIEAGFAGLPIVATDVPGARTVLRDGVTGIVVPPDDPGAFHAAVSRLCGDVGLRQAMGTAARDRVATQFSLDASAQRWRDVLAELSGSAGW